MVHLFANFSAKNKRFLAIKPTDMLRRSNWVNEPGQEYGKPGTVLLRPKWALIKKIGLLIRRQVKLSRP